MKRLVPTFILIAYSAILVKVMVFKDMPTIRIGQLMFNFGGTDGGHPANFVPFKTIVPYLFGDQGLVIAGVNLIGNIALLVPIGLLAPFVFRNMTWKKYLALSVAAGLIIEITQAVLRLGIFDIDDVILNALGVMTGYWACVVLAKWVRSRKYKNIVITAIIVTAAIAAAFYALYPKGQPVVNPAERAASQSDNLCGGTRGTGQITGIGDNTITIKRNDDSLQTINLTNRTTIRTSAGAASKTDLKVRDRVTVVVDESETAATVLVCSI
ncbi:MAG TPA: VanZ family protein [Nevskiaceae bacterium]|nr:VanZ family protein [Nevskiaceae bacterium]